MKILVACEESQVVCSAFRAKGHEAYSCDLLATSGQHSEWHVQADCLLLLKTPCTFTTCDGTAHTIDKWDMLIAFPPCTYLARIGACNNTRDPSCIEKGFAAKEFFMQLLNADIERVCVENPIPQAKFGLPKESMHLQPFEFGHPYTKHTKLWLRNLPPLLPTVYTCGHNFPSWTKLNKKGIKDRAKIRSKTFPGVALAMTEQWG